MKQKYSVCICNYNMADTIERALTSVLDQLDDEYEVLVIDDGSTDESVDIIKRLCGKYSILRYIALKRDRKRKLGETRNFSVVEARGKYVLLHIDADDVWEPYIKDFVTLFHRIEKCAGRDILLSGQQINIGKREFLLNYGPYRNTHRAQDRDMWLRLAADDVYIPLDHRVFRTRLSRPRKIIFFKSFRDTWYHMLYDLRKGHGVQKYILKTFTGLFLNRSKNFSVKHRLARAIMILPVFIASKLVEPLPPPKNMENHNEFIAYRERTRGTYSQIMLRHHCNPDLSFLSPEAQEIFSNSEKK